MIDPFNLEVTTGDPVHLDGELCPTCRLPGLWRASVYAVSERGLSEAGYIDVCDSCDDCPSSEAQEGIE